MRSVARALPPDQHEKILSQTPYENASSIETVF